MNYFRYIEKIKIVIKAVDYVSGTLLSASYALSFSSHNYLEV